MALSIFGDAGVGMLDDGGEQTAFLTTFAKEQTKLGNLQGQGLILVGGSAKKAEFTTADDDDVDDLFGEFAIDLDFESSPNTLLASEQQKGEGGDHGVSHTGVERHSAAVHQPLPCPAITRPDQDKADEVPDDNGAAKDFANDVLALPRVAQQEQHSQQEAPDGQQQKQPEQGGEQQAPLSEEEQTADVNGTAHMGANAKCNMQDAEPAARVPDVDDTAPAASDCPVCCMQTQILPASGLPSMPPMSAAAAAQTTPADIEMPDVSFDQAQNQHNGYDMHSARGQDEEAKHLLLQSSQATMDGDNEEGIALDVKQLETVPAEQPGIEQIDALSVDADGGKDGTAHHSQHLAVPEQQSATQTTPDIADMPCTAEKGQLAAASAAEGILFDACKVPAGDREGSEQYHMQQQEQQGTDPKQGMPNAVSGPHAAAEHKNALHTASPTLPAIAANSENVSEALTMAPQAPPPAVWPAAAKGYQKPPDRCKNSAGSLIFPKLPEPQALFEPARSQAPPPIRLPGQHALQAPSTSLKASVPATRLNKRLLSILPQHAMKRLCSPMNQPQLLQSGGSPAKRAGPSASDQASLMPASGGAAPAAMPGPSIQVPQQAEDSHPVTSHLQQSIPHHIAKAASTTAGRLTNLPTQDLTGRPCSKDCGVAQGLAALTGTLNQLPQIIRSRTPPQGRPHQQAAACKSPPPRLTPLLASGAGKQRTGGACGSIGAKMPASSMLSDGIELMRTGGCSKSNTPARMTPALQRHAMPDEAPPHLPASRCALHQQKDAHKHHPGLQQQPLLQAPMAPVLPATAAKCTAIQALGRAPSSVSVQRDSCPVAAPTVPGHEGQEEVEEGCSPEPRSATALLHRSMRALEAMLHEAEKMQDEALELKVAVAIVSNRIIRLDNPIINGRLSAMKAEADARMRCEE